MPMPSLRKWHRWLGLGLGWLMLAWFISGAVMMYAHLPGKYKSAEGRSAGGPILDPARVKVDFAGAWLAAGQPANLAEARLSHIAGRPAYLFRPARGKPTVVWADTGQVLNGVDQRLAARAAGQALGAGQPFSYLGLVSVDQWTVGSGARAALRPFHLFAVRDGQASRVYVSAVSGEVCHASTRWGRFWSWLGAIPHWLYFTALREHRDLWRWSVIALAALGCLLCLSGLWIGIRFFKLSGWGKGAKRRKSAFIGWRRWHHYLGLVFGLPALAFSFSGMMSLHPFDWLGSAGRPQGPRAAFSRGNHSPSQCSLDMALALAELGGHMEPRLVRLISFQGRPFYLALSGKGDSRLVAADQPQPRVLAQMPRESLEAAAAGLLPGAKLQWLSKGDLYLPRWNKPVLKAICQDASQTWLYLDPARAAIIKRLDGHGRVNRWLYHFLHCLDLPWLMAHRPVRDAILLFLMAGGAALSFGGPWSWLRRRRGAKAHRRRSQPEKGKPREKNPKPGGEIRTVPLGW